MRRTASFIVCLSLAALCGSAFAAGLADLPWDDRIPAEVRGGVRTALWKERDELQSKKNEAGKTFTRVYSNPLAIEILPDGKVINFLTIQRCLADKMVTERWKYTLEKKGKDYEIIAREKVQESDDSLLTTVEPPSKARQVKPFTFTHDLLTLTFDGGAYIVGKRGESPTSLRISGTGRLKLSAVDDFEKIYWQRRIEKTSMDTAVTDVEISFEDGNRTFTDLIGWEAGKPGAPAAATSGLQSMYDEWYNPIKDYEYAPYRYDPPLWPELQAQFRIRAKTADHGWIVYSYNPTSVKEIDVYLERGGLSLRQGDKSNSLPLTQYYGPETRKLPLADRELRRSLRPAEGIRFDAQFDIAADKFSAIVDADIRVLRDADDLIFYLSGNPSVRSVKLDGGEDLIVVPQPSLASRIFGIGADRDVVNLFRVILPKKVPAGTQLRVTVAYDSPKIVRMIDSGFWYIDRFGFLPFGGTLDDTSYMHFVVRTTKDYDHIAIGSQIRNEIVGDHRYTEWGADSGFNFPTLIIGRYFPPIELENYGVKFTGYMTRSFAGDKSMPVGGLDPAEIDRIMRENPADPKPSAMEPQIQQAAASVELFTKLFRSPYAFRDLKLVGTPAQFLSAQSPSSIVYIGEAIFYSDAVLARIFKGLDPTWTHNVTAHEVGHQWFGGQVSNISNHHYWFVETFAEVASAIYSEVLKDFNSLRGMRDGWRKRAFGIDWAVPLVDDTARYEPGTRGTDLRYTKGPYIFWMLREYFSREQLVAFLRNVIQAHAGDLISTSQVQAVAEKTFNQKMDWFFDQYVRDIGIPEVRYRFDAPRPAEDGKGWIISGRFEQTIQVRGEAVPGKFFRNLLVPLDIETDKGMQRVREVVLNEPGKDILIRVEGKPKGTPKVNPDDICYMTTKSM